MLDLRPDAIQADFLVIATGTSDRQLGALLDYVRQGIKDDHQRVPYSVDGTANSGWIVLDYGDVVVHIFIADVREFYDIESLWHNRAKVLLSIQ